MGASKTIECVYEGGVLKPLEKVDFKEGERLRLKVERFDIAKFCGAFGEGSGEEFERFEEEAQSLPKDDWSHCSGQLLVIAQKQASMIYL